MAFKYRQPVIILGDGYLGQVTSQVKLPKHMVEPGIPAWATAGDREHRANLVTSIRLTEADLEKLNHHLNDIYAEITENEQRADLFKTDDCEVLFVAANTPARMTKGAIRTLRAQGIKAGLFRPVSLWPFPIKALAQLLKERPIRRIVVVEASHGQLEDEMRLALSHAGITELPPIAHVQHSGGILPQSAEIAQVVLDMEVPQ